MYSPADYCSAVSFTMALRKGVAGLLPRLVSGNSQLLAPTCSASTSLSAVLGGAGSSSAVDGKCELRRSVVLTKHSRC